MALGGVGMISVVSNEIPAEMAQLCEAGLKGDFAAAREIHSRYLPLMEVNFVESSPGPVKAAMAMMGLLELLLSPADGAAQNRKPREDRESLD